MSDVASNQNPFTLRLRVRYAECDAQQVVFNARYGDYVDLAATEFLRAVIGGYQALLEMGLDSQVVRLLTEWKSPARFDDVLEISVNTGHLGNSSYRLDFTLRQTQSNTLVATAEATYVVVDASTFQKQSIPDELRQLLQQGAPGKLCDQSGGLHI